MAFYENDIPFTAKLLDGSDPVAGEFAKIWPLGKFPVLVDDGRLVFDATTIIEHLDVHYPGSTRFVPVDAAMAVEVRMMDRFFDNYIQTPMQRIVAIAGGMDVGEPARERSRLDTAYEWLDDRLAGREWAAGAFGLADCAAAPALLYADWAHPIPSRFEALRHYRARLLARPSYTLALDEARPYRGLFPLRAPEGWD